MRPPNVSLARDKLSIDDAPFQVFHLRLAIYSCGGPFTDGYILGIIAIVLSALSRDIGLSPLWQGTIAAGSLVGMFIGGGAFGYVTDRVGRQLMYTIDLALLAVASVAQIWVTGPLTLLALRFILGVAIGADYPIAATLLSEFAPRRQRGMLMSSMIAAWWLGYTTSFLLGYWMVAQWGDGHWRWILASSAIPALVVIFLRWGTPESPRWLMSQGRVEEARAILKKFLGISAPPNFQDIPNEPEPVVRVGELFGRLYRARAVFICVFWSCQVVPTFAIFTYAPVLLGTFGVENPLFGAALMSLWFIAGAIPAIFLVDWVGRRPLLIIPFAIQALVLATLPLVPTSQHLLTSVAFILFALANSASSVLQWVYPSELFPTEIRATALGLGTAVSRVSAAIGTFLVPVMMGALGVKMVMLTVAGVCAIGFAVSLRIAPETRGMSLQDSSMGTLIG